MVSGWDKKMRMFFALLMVGSLLNMAAAQASSCNHISTTKIRFKRGATCWEYSGTNNQYAGVFSAGQRITVSMFGLATFAADDDQIEKKWLPRNPSVSGPNSFFATSEIDQDDGKMAFVAPTTGRYVFEFGPCAMWGGYGEVRICAE